MVIGPKMSIQHVPSKGKISMMKIHNFTVQRRQSVVRIVYGGLLVLMGLITVIVDPVNIATNWFLEMREGSFVFKMWQKPTYQLFCEVWVYNYTNVPAYMNGESKTLKVEEIGPFLYQEIRTNENMTIDEESGVLKLIPNTTLKFLLDQSVADPKSMSVLVPNIALLAISTVAADKMGYLANIGAYYSISALDPKLFKNITVEDYFWGYYDPLVSIANKLVPGWIDFSKIGIMDRFYAQKAVSAEVELRDPTMKYTLRSWGKSEGLVEQGFTDLNTSTGCNRIKGTYEGLMFTPGVSRTKILPLFRKQACRVYPFKYQQDVKGSEGFTYYRFELDRSSFNNTSPYACKCTENCPPDGLVDIGRCYYGFPILLSKPHFLDADPALLDGFEGIHADVEKDNSEINIEPNTGTPITLRSNIQVNIAVRSSNQNPITKPLDKKILPLIWISMFCPATPQEVINILWLRLVLAPPLVITIEVFLFALGIFFGIQGGYRIWKPRYKLIENKTETPRRRKTSYPLATSDNMAFKDDEQLAKEAVSLLAIKEEHDDHNIPDLLIET